MNRARIESAVFALAEKRGYTPFVYEGATLETPISAMPAAWLKPLKLIDIEGRTSGRIRHQLELVLLSDSGCKSLSDKLLEFQKMENDILDIFLELSTMDGIVAIDDVVISPSAKSATRHGDISQYVKARCVSYF